MKNHSLGRDDIIEEAEPASMAELHNWIADSDRVVCF